MAHLTQPIENRIAVCSVDTAAQTRLSPEMLDGLGDALAAIGNSDARALLLRAEGADFSFGGDIVPWPDMSARELRTLFERYMIAFNQFERLSIPTVAAVQGLCFGGGLELAVRSDVVIRPGTAPSGHPQPTL